jgi:N-acetylglutamate synthase-like GNAT family acetyltransferase
MKAVTIGIRKVYALSTRSKRLVEHRGYRPKLDPQEAPGSRRGKIRHAF